jgi:hypothetical protein
MRYRSGVEETKPQLNQLIWNRSGMLFTTNTFIQQFILDSGNMGSR